MSVKKYFMVLWSMAILVYNPCLCMDMDIREQNPQTNPLIATPTIVRHESSPSLDFTNVHTADDSPFDLKTTERKSNREQEMSALENKEAKAVQAEYAIGVNHKARREKGSAHKYVSLTEGGSCELNRRCCTFTPDGKKVIMAFRQPSGKAGAYDNNIEVHKLSTGTETDFNIGAKHAHAMAFNPEGTIVALVQPYAIELWSSQKVLIQKIPAKTPSFRLDSGSDGSSGTREIFYGHISFSEDGKRFFVISAFGKQLMLLSYMFEENKKSHQNGWRLFSTHAINSKISHKYQIISLLPSGYLLVTPNEMRGQRRSLAIMDPVAEKFARIDTQENIEPAVSSVSVGGDYIVTAGQDNNFKIIEVRTGKVVLTDKLMHYKGLRSIKLSPDYEHLLMNYEDGTITLMKIKKLEEKQSPVPVNWEKVAEVASHNAPDNAKDAGCKCIVM